MIFDCEFSNQLTRGVQSQSKNLIMNSENRSMFNQPVQIAQLFYMECLIFNQYSKQHLKKDFPFDIGMCVH